jgi:RNA ligase (TIGR02306 family)
MKVATIERIAEINPHPNADALELAKINGWQVCVKKNEFKVDSLCIYITVDSVLEDCSQYEFLRNKHFRIKTIKLRGALSQGIAFPISLLKSFGHDIVPLDDKIEGTDVADLVKAKHYEKPVPANLAGQIKGYRPSYIKKTDEDNIKSNPNLIKELLDKPYVITVKVDGSSGTFYVKDNVFGVCSRNLELKQEDNNAFWKIATKHNLENKIKQYFPNKNIALQGEVYGPNIQDNLLGINEISFAAFNLFDIDNQVYLGHFDLLNFTNIMKIPMVKVLEIGNNFNYTLEQLQTKANELVYDNGNLAEGIVIRTVTETHSETLNGRLSGKVVSEPFELKYA